MKTKLLVAFLLLVLGLGVTACGTHTVLPPDNKLEFTFQFEGKEGDTFVLFKGDGGNYKFDTDNVVWVYDRESDQSEYVLITDSPGYNQNTATIHLRITKAPADE